MAAPPHGKYVHVVEQSLAMKTALLLGSRIIELSGWPQEPSGLTNAEGQVVFGTPMAGIPFMEVELGLGLDMAPGIEKIVGELKTLGLKLPKEKPLPTDELIAAYEKNLNMHFTAEYKYFLKEASNILLNGMDVLQLTETKSSARELQTFYEEAKEQGLPKDWLPFCEDNGDYYCLLNDGSVRFWSHNGLSNEKWESLTDWISKVWINGE